MGVSRCLICYSEEETITTVNAAVSACTSVSASEQSLNNAKSPGPRGQTPSLKNQLNADVHIVFALRNLFDVPGEDLENHLVRWGSPSNWIRLCGRCDEAVTNAKNIYQKVLDATRMLRSVKQEIIEMMKRSITQSQQNGMNGEGDNVKEIKDNYAQCLEKENMEVTDLVRLFVGNREYNAIATDPFIVGDSEAEELVRGLSLKIQDLEEDVITLDSSSSIEDEMRNDDEFKIITEDDVAVLESKVIREDMHDEPDAVASETDFLKETSFEPGEPAELVNSQIEEPSISTVGVLESKTLDNQEASAENSTDVPVEYKKSVTGNDPNVETETPVVTSHPDDDNCIDIDLSSSADANVPTSTDPSPPQKILLHTDTTSTETEEGLSASSESQIGKPENENAESTINFSVTAKMSEGSLESQLSLDADNNKGNEATTAPRTSLIHSQEQDLLSVVKESKNDSPDGSIIVGNIEHEPVAAEKHNPTNIIIPPAEENKTPTILSLCDETDRFSNKSKSTTASTTIQLSFKIPKLKLPVIKKESKTEDKSVNNQPSPNPFIIPKFPITSRVPKEKEAIKSFTDEDLNPAGDGKATLIDLEGAPSPISNTPISAIKSEKSEDKQDCIKPNSPPSTANIDSATSSISKNQSAEKTETSSTPVQVVVPKSTLTNPTKLMTPPKLHNNPPTTQDPFSDLDPLLAELLSLPPTIKPQSGRLPLTQSDRKSLHAKMGRAADGNGGFRHLCLCGRSYITNSRVLQHIRQMSQSAPKSGPTTAAKPSLQTEPNIQNALVELHDLEKEMVQTQKYSASKIPAERNIPIARNAGSSQNSALKGFPSKNQNSRSSYATNLLKTLQSLPKNSIEIRPVPSHSGRIPLPKYTRAHNITPSQHLQGVTTSPNPEIVFQKRPNHIRPSVVNARPHFSPRSTLPQVTARQHFTTPRPPQIQRQHNPLIIDRRRLKAVRNPKWYHCGQCLHLNPNGGNEMQQRFISLADLTKHVHSVHGGWKCRMPNCERQFATHLALQTHVLQQQCSVEAYKTSKIQLVKTAPISLRKVPSPKKLARNSSPMASSSSLTFPSSNGVRKTIRAEQDIVCIDLDD